jgi:hypothetical protein
VEFLESIADGTRKATNAEMNYILGGRARNVAEKSKALRATIGNFAQEYNSTALWLCKCRMRAHFFPQKSYLCYMGVL